jgi:malonyl CoA-acyl carrier protein transacylase
MSDQSRMHPYFDWAKMRIDEMDVTLALFERQIESLEANARGKAQGLLTAMRKERDAFLEKMKKQAHASEAALTTARHNMEAQWNAFETNVQKYINDVERQVDQGRAAFQARADAQMKAWQESIQKLRDTAKGYAAGQRAKVEATAMQMKKDAQAAEARLQKLSVAGAVTSAAFTTALAETRAAFDRASQVAHNAVRSAIKPAI